MKTTTLILSAIIAALPFSANATQTIVQTQTPAAVGSDGTVKKAAATGPYVTNEPTVDDQTHIATTAYVKGAYNDAIAAVNKVDSDKQVKLKNAANNNPVLPKVLSGNVFDGLASDYMLHGTDPEYAEDYATLTEDIAHSLTGEHNNAVALNDTLISAGTVMQWMREAGDAINVRQAQIVNNDGDPIEAELMSPQNFVDTFDSYVEYGDTSILPSDDTLVSAKSIILTMDELDNRLQYSIIPMAIDSKRVTIYTTWGNDTAAATTKVALSNQ